MSSTATLVYTAQPKRATAAALAALMLAVEYPPEILTALGVYIMSDTASEPGGVSVRTTVLGLVAPTPGSVVATTVDKGASGSALATLPISSGGSGYVVPPILVIAPPPRVFQTQSQVGDADYPATGICLLSVGGATIVAGGTLYGMGTTISFVGGLGPGGVAATATLTINPSGGAITGIAITSAGSGYISAPKVVLTALTGSGANITVQMKIGSTRVVTPGTGYAPSSTPTVTVVDYFKSLFPDGTDQTLPFYDLLTTALKRAICAPVLASPPLIA
jgi:hypothetical protein